MDTYRKILYTLTIGTTLACSYICVAAYTPKAYEVRIDNKTVAMVKDSKNFENIKSSIESGLKKRFGEVKIESKLSIAPTDSKNILLTKDSDVKNKILEKCKIEVNALKMYSDSKEIAIVANENEGNSLLEQLKGYYSSNTGNYKIKSSSIKNKITYAPAKVTLSVVDSVEKALDRVTKKNKSEKFPIVSVVLKAENETKETVAPSTVVNWDKDMEEGKSKVINEGSSGSKTVTREVTIENRTVMDKKVISEKVSVPPKDRVIAQGNKKVVSSSAASRGAYSSPSRGVITSVFGERWGKMHKGVDIAGKTGDPVYAALDGVVLCAEVEDGYGKVVKLDHGNGLVTIYGHCSAFNVKVSQKVKKGDRIASVGSTGNSTGPHLHFEVREKGIAINPMKFLQ